MAKITDYKLILSTDPAVNEIRAANFLREAIRLVCGEVLPIANDASAAVEKEIVIGQTVREAMDGVSPDRTESGLWEYEIFTVGHRVYLTGLGTKRDPFAGTTEPKFYDDGQIGTVYAAYRFAEDVLGYSAVDADIHGFRERKDAEIPEGYRVSYTKKFLLEQLPEPVNGAALYMIPDASRPEMNMSCMIFRTSAGKLILVDGGFYNDAEHVVRVLESLSGGEKPVVSALLFSHLHPDHFGFYERLCKDPELKQRIKVERLYCNLLDEAFYATDSREASVRLRDVRRLMMDCEGQIGAALHVVENGDVIRVDEFSFEVLHVPQPEYRYQMNMNDSGVVYKLNYHDGEQSILLLGDAEWVCNKDLMERCPEKLKSDVVQVGHHGCGNVSPECYRKIGADVYLWQIGVRYRYSDEGEGLNSRNIGKFRTFGVGRTRFFIAQAGGSPENQYYDTFSIRTLKLPIPLKGGGSDD